jgi:hypothetical protein
MSQSSAGLSALVMASVRPSVEVAPAQCSIQNHSGGAASYFE